MEVVKYPINYMDNDIVSTLREKLRKFIRELHRLTLYVKLLDTLNILYLWSKDFIEVAERIISPRQMFISKNDGKCNGDMIHSRDTIINANSMKSLSKYTDEEISRIIRLQNMQ